MEVDHEVCAPCDEIAHGIKISFHIFGKKDPQPDAPLVTPATALETWTGTDQDLGPRAEYKATNVYYYLGTAYLEAELQAQPAEDGTLCGRLYGRTVYSIPHLARFKTRTTTDQGGPFSQPIQVGTYTSTAANLTNIVVVPIASSYVNPSQGTKVVATIALRARGYDVGTGGESIVSH
jgi:hypothetical protein